MVALTQENLILRETVKVNKLLKHWEVLIKRLLNLVKHMVTKKKKAVEDAGRKKVSRDLSGFTTSL